jgi:hypothetical protein
MAYQSKKGIPLAHRQYLRNGQIIGSAETIATKSTRSKDGAVSTHPGMRDRNAEASALVPGVAASGKVIATKTYAPSTKLPQDKCAPAPTAFGMTGGNRGKAVG